jgi:hypothetical protein
VDPAEATETVQKLVDEGYLVPGYVDSDGVWEDNPEGTYGLVDGYRPDRLEGPPVVRNDPARAGCRTGRPLG